MHIQDTVCVAVAMNVISRVHPVYLMNVQQRHAITDP